MRTLSLIIVAVLLYFPMHGQPWLANLPQGRSSADLTLFDYQQAFESYWAPFNVSRGTYLENGVTKKAAGWKQFRRWEHEMKSHVNPTTGKFPSKTALQVRDEFERANPRSGTSRSANWTPLGPDGSNSGYAGIGRINCVAFHPTDMNTYWVGAAAGGLWMTTDNGISWTCQTNNNGVLAVSDIIIHPAYDANGIIYIATGDRDGWDNRSIGVLKSTDRGATWNTTGLSFTIYEGRMTNRLLIDPINSEVLYAATTAGVFKTIDGGITWNTQMTGVEFIDMEFQPGNATTIYGSTKNGAIYRSIDGNTFPSPVFSDGAARRIELAVSPNQPGWVYALCANSESGLYGIFKSLDGGASFTQVFSGNEKNLLTWASDGSGSGGQGWYDLAMAASPIDANIILVGGVNSWRSVDGGTSWSIINHWWGDGVQAVHADKHAHAFRSNGDVFECNDGGIYLSTNNGSNWTDKTNGMQISQMYKLGVSQTEEGDVITGLQDNGSKLYSGGEWSDVRGGDGMECLIDYSDVNIQYSTVYYGLIDRTTNHWQNATAIQPLDNGAWVTPYIIDPNNPNILYAGYDDVWQTINRGDTWTQISFLDVPGKLQAMAIAPSDSRWLYITNHSTLWRTTDAGATWTDVTNNIPTGNGSIQYITVKNDDPATVWVALSGYGNANVFQSTDGGQTWVDISSGLPPIPAYSLVQNHQAAPAVELYLGTELGVYYKNGNNDWIPYNTGLPNVKTGEIEIYYASNPEESKLRAATYGRGLWETPIDYTAVPMTFLSATSTQNNTSLVAPGATNQEIIKVEVTTNGSLNPLELTSFTFNTNGSTNALADIANATLYATGTINAFSTSTPFGNAVPSPDGSFTITGMQTLSNGKNNFWLTYDVATTATIDNVLDAQCTEVILGTSHIPVVTDPPGNRTIGIEYCEAGATEDTYEYISSVEMGDILQVSGKGDDGYEDNTAMVIDMEIGIAQSISVGIGEPYSSDELLIWVDWNMDGDFLDNDETVYASGPTGFSVYETSFAPPASARTGITRMRIRLNDADNGSNSTPCGYASWGEIEDYSIYVLSPDTCGVLNYFDFKAQSIPGDYVSLGSEGTIISTSDFDNANSDVQDIGFAFDFKCQSFTQFVLNTNGFIKLGDTPPSSPGLVFDDPRSNDGGLFNNNDPADVNILSALNIDLTAGTGSPEYRVHTSGTAPYRICTIQYQDVREAGTDPVPQFDNIQFQIKLYETTNVIEFVYGDWTPSGNANDFRTVGCGLKGSSRLHDQVLVVSKGSGDEWSQVNFSNTNYRRANPFLYSKPPESPKPDAGRTFRFIPTFYNDLAAEVIYTFGESSLYYSSPQPVAVNIVNTGLKAMTNIPITLSASGANSFEDTQYIPTIESGENKIVHFSPLMPDGTGYTDLVVSLPQDDGIVNNISIWNQNVTDFDCNVASMALPASPLELTPGESFIFLVKYYITGTASVKAIKTFIPNDISNIGQTVYGVVMNSAGSIVAQSDPYLIEESALGTWYSFEIPAPPVFTDAQYYAGLAANAAAEIYYPLGVQEENPLRPETFYLSDLSGNNISPYLFPNRLMIGATLAPTQPVAGIAGSDLVLCSGDDANIQVAQYSGALQWQESPDGISNWTNVTSGSGANASLYTSPLLSTTTFYRVEVTQPTFAPVYSNNVWIQVIPTPQAAGLITGDETLCQGDDVVIYHVDPIENALSYVWTLPEGATGVSDSNVIYVTFSPTALSGTITVAGNNSGCSGTAAALPVAVYPVPATPVINNDAGEQNLRSDSPTGNQWYDQNGIIIGATEQDYFADTDGMFYVIVTENGCSSLPSNIIPVFISAVIKIGQSLDVKLYPNPVSDELYIEVPGNINITHYEIHNAIGVVTAKGEFSEKVKVETARFIPGVYLVHLESNGYTTIKKFVKE